MGRKKRERAELIFKVVKWEGVFLRVSVWHLMNMVTTGS